MYLDTLSIINFKNIRQAEITCSPRINCFVGDNGTGKTNILDAINYLSMCKSAFNLSDSQCTTHEQELFALNGRYAANERTENINCAYRRGQSKKMSRGAKEYEKLSDHIGLIPIVMITPSDTSLINDSGEERRRYLNALISQLDKEYLTNLIRYNRLLAERNKLLKSQSTRGFDELLEVMDAQMAPLGDMIHSRRADFVETLAPLVAKYYAMLSGDREQVELCYRSDLSAGPMEGVLHAAGERDRINQFTTCGIHRDDIRMVINSHPLRKYGSQGQQKSFLVALKLAQYDTVAGRSTAKPILLLDDIFDKLDMQRVEQLIDIVADERFSQIFITDCNKVRLESVLRNKGCHYTLFNVSGGEVTRIEGEKL